MARAGKRKKSVARLAPDFVLDEVVVPAPVPKRVKPVYFPFAEMSVGQSFTTMRHPSTLVEAIKRHKRSGHADEGYRLRPLPEGGCRVWRVK